MASSLFKRLKQGLSKTRKSLAGGLEKIFSGKKSIDEDMFEDLEELLITSDIGVRTTMKLMERITAHSGEISDVDQLKKVLREETLSFLKETPAVSKEADSRPKIIMVVGVNGTGKTTTVGKLAAKFSNEGKKVLIAAADTFRAAAIEQLEIWAERAGADIVKHKENADPSAVAFDAVEAATARNVDVLLIDTAGRLHTRVNLMEELKKIKRTISKRCAGAPHKILLVLDATTGQNALSQAELFNEALGITDLALTKLDGTAKGGIVLSICHRLNVPLSYIGVGEKLEDLHEFDPKQFVDALF
jgi:fused signal recognition particle receptor